MTTPSHILAVNAGSSSVKFSVYETALKPICEGEIERIGMEDAFVSIKNSSTGETTRRTLVGEPVEMLVAILTELNLTESIIGIGHRVVHGGAELYSPTLISEEVLRKLENVAHFAPRHLPVEIALIRKFTELLPRTPHIACFDTAFHHTLPQSAQLIPVPLRYRSAGVRRYGFHGLSYEYLLEALKTSYGVPVQDKRIVLAHLGSGSSLAAVSGGVSVETTMSLTPNSGVPMGTRTGDIDAGIFEYFTDSVGMTPSEFNHMVNYESGLLAISGTSADMEVLLRNAKTDATAEEAIAYYAYHVRKQIGALAASMGGIDILVFTGGIGERSAEMRSRIVSELGFLGIHLDASRNENGEGLIAEDTSPTAVYVIPTNEELIIARHVTAVLNGLS